MPEVLSTQDPVLYLRQQGEIAPSNFWDYLFQPKNDIIRVFLFWLTVHLNKLRTKKGGKDI